MEPSGLPTILYHYTDARGLLGIIQKQEVWASHIRYLNDSEEFDYAVNLAQGVIRGRAEATANQKEKEVLTALSTRLSPGRMVDVFVASFSEDGDLLSQWRGYCPNGAGYSIGFVARDLRSEAGIERFSLLQCCYEYEDQREIIRHVLNEVMNSARWTQTLEEFQNEDLYHRAAELWFESFVPVAPIIKHGGFSEEREWRLISKPLSLTDPRRRVRAGRSMLIPYVPIKLTGFGSHIPIKEIIVGPTPHMKLAQMAVWGWLESKDISPVDVLNSRIPYRDRS